MLGRFVLAVLLSCVTCGGAIQATEPPVIAVDISTLSDGSYVLVKAGGTVTLRPLQLIVPSVAPTPIPPQPQPSVLTARQIAFRDKTQAVATDAAKAQGPALAALYRQVGKSVRTGQLGDAATAAMATKAATDLLLTTNAAPWAGVRQTLSDEWTKLQTSGAPIASYAELLEDAAVGIEAASPRAIDPAMLALILEIVKIILALFKPV
jgi:hypothetical protein